MFVNQKVYLWFPNSSLGTGLTKNSVLILFYPDILAWRNRVSITIPFRNRVSDRGNEGNPRRRRTQRLMPDDTFGTANLLESFISKPEAIDSNRR